MVALKRSKQMQGARWEEIGFVKYLLILHSNQGASHYTRLRTSYPGRVRKTQATSERSDLVELVVMRRPRVGRKALALSMGEPMNNRRRKKAEQILRSRRRMSSNNSSRLWELWWRLFVESLLTLADDGRRA
jgi:hypothetical protein